LGAFLTVQAWAAADIDGPPDPTLQDLIAARHGVPGPSPDRNTGEVTARLYHAQGLAEPDPPAAPRVTADIVGRWEVYLANGDHWILEFRPDASYTLHADGYGHSGHYDALPTGQWSLRASTTDFVDRGNFALAARDTLYLAGQYGQGSWARVHYAPWFARAPYGGEALASLLPAVVEREVLAARSEWRADAIPVMLDVRQTPYGGFELELSLFAPASGSGRVVTLRRFERTIRDVASPGWGARAIAPDFIDLPRAVHAARDDGMSGPFEEALLRTVEGTGTVWRITAEAGTAHDVQAVAGPTQEDRASWDAVIEELGYRFPGTIVAAYEEIYRVYCGDKRYAAWAADDFAGSC
jgi:hypothetical protein